PAAPRRPRAARPRRTRLPRTKRLPMPVACSPRFPLPARRAARDVAPAYRSGREAVAFHVRGDRHPLVIVEHVLPGRHAPEAVGGLQIDLLRGQPARIELGRLARVGAGAVTLDALLAPQLLPEPDVLRIVQKLLGQP